MNETTRLSPTSQIMETEPYFHGPISRHIIQTQCEKIVATLHCREPSEREIELGYIDPPVCSWSIEREDGTPAYAGPLSFLSFLFLHTTQVEKLENIKIETRIEYPEFISGINIITNHPSGLFQSIKFNENSNEFFRSILYITNDLDNS